MQVLVQRSAKGRQRPTGARRQPVTQKNVKLAITDRCKQENQVMEWEKAKVLRTLDNRHRRSDHGGGGDPKASPLFHEPG